MSDGAGRLEGAPGSAAPSEPAVPLAGADGGATGAGSQESIAAEVSRLKAILEQSASTTAAVVEALDALRALGGLPTKVLSDTMVGKVVNQLAKAAPDEAVRTKAKGLVEEWKQLHRKRKSSSSLAEAGVGPPLKRGSSASIDASPKDCPAKSEEGLPGGVQGTPRLEKVDSTFSLGSVAEAGTDQSGAEGKMEPYREKVLQKLIEALGKEEEIETKGEDKGEEGQRDPVVLAGEIEEALASAKPKKEAYLSQARSVLYNLKDSKNPTFRFKLMVGFYKPEDVPGLTAEDMASDEKNAERAAQRKYAMEEIQSDWALKHGQQRITGMFTCGKCKGVKTTYFQMQTRSSDEPMTTFVTCLTCNNRWKFC